MLNPSWQIRSRSRKCAVSGEAFHDGETIVTALFPDPDSSGYLRHDYSLGAWDARPADAEPPFSSWRTIFAAVEVEEKADPMKREDPESLLRRLVEEDENHTENVRYILAVMLERQKLLIETDSQHMPTGILRVYEHRKTGEAFIIRDPNIPLTQVEQVQEEVIFLLENGGRRTPAASGETDASEETPPADNASSEPTPGENPAGTTLDETSEQAATNLATPPCTPSEKPTHPGGP